MDHTIKTVQRKEVRVRRPAIESWCCADTPDATPEEYESRRQRHAAELAAMLDAAKREKRMRRSDYRRKPLPMPNMDRCRKPRRGLVGFAVVATLPNGITETYQSMTQAAQALSVTHSTISAAVNGRNKTCAGRTWKRECECVHLNPMRAVSCGK